MNKTRHEKYLQMKSAKKMELFFLFNKKIQKSIAVMGTTAFIGLYSSPVAQVLSGKSAVAHAATAASRFLQNIVPAAQTVAKDKNIYASVMIAQAALESGWGTSALASAPNHNLFGVKGNYNGQSVNMRTLEDSGGQNYYSIQANFRKYPSYQESLEDYAKLILNGISGAPQFYAGAWKSNTTSYREATAYLTGRYATDTAYGSKLNRIIEQYGLTKYDNATAIAVAEEIIQNQSANEPTTGGASYIVVRGDGLYAISRKTGVAINDLLSLNGLSLSSVIYPGQVLKLSNRVATPAPETTPTASANTAATTSTGSSYTVVRGDGLYAISRKTGVAINDLLSLNGLSLSSVIYPGQVLKLSSGVATSAPETTQTTTANTAATTSTVTTYTVVRGDGLYAISRKTGVAINDLLSLNGLSLSSVIYPGQVLKLSNRVATSAPAPTPSATQTSAPASTVTPASATTTTNSATGTYTIKSGDTLYRIAYANGISLATLLELNQLSANSLIYPGQQLKVQGTSNAAVSTSTNTSSRSSAGQKTYTVKAGDGLWRIARNHGLSLDALKNLNKLTSNIIQPGQVLIVAQ